MSNILEMSNKTYEKLYYYYYYDYIIQYGDMIKILHFVQPTTQGHVTSHTSTILHQSSSTFFTTITTTISWCPLPFLTFPVPYHHLHNMSRHGYDGRNMPTMSPQYNRLKMCWMQLETQQGTCKGQRAGHTSQFL